MLRNRPLLAINCSLLWSVKYQISKPFLSTQWTQLLSLQSTCRQCLYKLLVATETGFNSDNLRANTIFLSSHKLERNQAFNTQYANEYTHTQNNPQFAFTLINLTLLHSLITCINCSLFNFDCFPKKKPTTMTYALSPPSYHSLQFIYFLVLMTSLTCALVLAAQVPDPRRYDRPVDVFRGVCEGIFLLITTYNSLAELNQLRM